MKFTGPSFLAKQRAPSGIEQRRHRRDKLGALVEYEACEAGLGCEPRTRRTCPALGSV